MKSKLTYSYKEPQMSVSDYFAPVTDSKGRSLEVTDYLFPANLNLEKLLENSGNQIWLKPLRFEKLAYIINKIIKAYVHGPAEWGSLVNINATHLQKVLTHDLAKPCISLLESLKVIRVNNSYKGGGFSKSYALTFAYARRGIKLARFTTDKTREIPSTEKTEIENEIQEFALNNIGGLSFDLNGLKSASAGVKMPVERLARLGEVIHRLETGTATLRAGRTVRRLFHSVLRMPKEFRPFLRHRDGRELMEIDLKSAQPVILLSLYPKDCPEAETYKVCLETGFYSTLAPGIPKDEVKRQFGVFISGKYSELNFLGQSFTALFPILASRIREFKGSVACYLQNMEADIMVYTVLAKCRELGIFAIPMHDGLLIEAGKEKFVSQIIIDTFTFRFGYKAKIGIEWQQTALGMAA